MENLISKELSEHPVKSENALKGATSLKAAMIWPGIQRDGNLRECLFYCVIVYFRPREQPFPTDAKQWYAADFPIKSSLF